MCSFSFVPSASLFISPSALICHCSLELDSFQPKQQASKSCETSELISLKCTHPTTSHVTCMIFFLKTLLCFYLLQLVRRPYISRRGGESAQTQGVRGLSGQREWERPRGVLNVRQVGRKEFTICTFFTFVHVSIALLKVCVTSKPLELFPWLVFGVGCRVFGDTVCRAVCLSSNIMEPEDTWHLWCSELAKKYIWKTQQQWLEIIHRPYFAKSFWDYFLFSPNRTHQLYRCGDGSANPPVDGALAG